jgi:hypothetical protein
MVKKNNKYFKFPTINFIFFLLSDIFIIYLLYRNLGHINDNNIINDDNIINNDNIINYGGKNNDNDIIIDRQYIY